MEVRRLIHLRPTGIDEEHHVIVTEEEVNVRLPPAALSGDRQTRQQSSIHASLTKNPCGQHLSFCLRMWGRSMNLQQSTKVRRTQNCREDIEVESRHGSSMASTSSGNLLFTSNQTVKSAVFNCRVGDRKISHGDASRCFQGESGRGTVHRNLMAHVLRYFASPCRLMSEWHVFRNLQFWRP